MTRRSAQSNKGVPSAVPFRRVFYPIKGLFHSCAYSTVPKSFTQNNRSTAEKLAREGLVRYAEENNFLIGPIRYEDRSDLHPSAGIHSILALAPGVANVFPQHREQVEAALQRPETRFERFFEVLDWNSLDVS